MKHLKNHIIRILTGWHSVDTFGNPKCVLGRYNVCLSNAFIIEMNYSILSERWFSHVSGYEHPDNPVVFWKQLPKRPMFFKIDG